MKIKLTCTNCVEPDSNVEQGTNKVAHVQWLQKITVFDE